MVDFPWRFVSLQECNSWFLKKSDSSGHQKIWHCRHFFGKKLLRKGANVKWFNMEGVSGQNPTTSEHRDFAPFWRFESSWDIDYINKCPRNLQQDPRFTDPEKTWVSNSSIVTSLGVRWDSVPIQFFMENAGWLNCSSPCFTWTPSFTWTPHMCDLVCSTPLRVPYPKKQNNPCRTHWGNPTN